MQEPKRYISCKCAAKRVPDQKRLCIAAVEKALSLGLSPTPRSTSQRMIAPRGPLRAPHQRLTVLCRHNAIALFQDRDHTDGDRLLAVIEMEKTNFLLRVKLVFGDLQALIWH